MTDQEILDHAERQAAFENKPVPKRVKLMRYSGCYNAAPIKRVVEYQQNQAGEWAKV